MSTTRKYGWIPDVPDHRDMLFAAPMLVTALPPKVDLTNEFPPVYDQGQLNSCTGNGIAAALQFDRMKQNLAPNFTPSRLFIYYNERVIEHSVESDCGAQIRDGIKSVAKQGACPESLWPYDTAKFASMPDAGCYASAKDNRAISYQRVPQIANQMKGCLAAGFPFVFGFTVYDSFDWPDTAKTGDVPMPQSTEQVAGGHCMVAVGYDDEAQCFLFRNSWNDTWGNKGYGRMPYAYLTDPNLARDFWTIRLVN